MMYDTGPAGRWWLSLVPTKHTPKGENIRRLISTVGISVLFLVSLSHGQQRWTRTYGGSNLDEARGAGQTADGGYIVSGWTKSFGAGDYDFYLIKTNASGDTLWTKTYGTAADERGGFVQQTTDGGYIFSGFSLPPTDSLGDIYLVKTNDQGDTLWTRKYAGANSHRGYPALQTADGGYIVSGATYSFGAGMEDIYLIKTNASGDTLWTRTYGGTKSDVGFGQQTTDGGYIITGYTCSFGDTLGDFWLVKTDASGDTLWTRIFGGTNTDIGFGGQQTTDGGYIIAGYTCSFGDTLGDVWLVKTNASGDTLWTRTYGGPNEDYGYGVSQAADGGYIVAGTTLSYGAGMEDVYLIKTDANGSVGVEEPVGGRQVAAGSISATLNPFTSFARVPGHEAEQFSLYDISGKVVGTCQGDRVGAGLSPAVYFIRLDDGSGRSLRIVKVR